MQAKMGICPFRLKDVAKYPHFETQFLENQAIGNQTFEKKNYGTRVPCEFFQITRFSSNQVLH